MPPVPSVPLPTSPPPLSPSHSTLAISLGPDSDRSGCCSDEEYDRRSIALDDPLPLERVPAAPLSYAAPDLAGISFHSPVSLLGTPFDSCSRFEYPFPPQAHVDGFDSSSPGATSPSLSDFSPTSPSAFVPASPFALPLSLPARSASVRHSPAHPKLATDIARNPPVPPGLFKKRRKRFSVSHRSGPEPAAIAPVKADQADSGPVLSADGAQTMPVTNADGAERAEASSESDSFGCRRHSCRL